MRNILSYNRFSLLVTLPISWTSQFFTHYDISQIASEHQFKRTGTWFRKINFKLPKNKFLIVVVIILIAFSFLLGGKFTKNSSGVVDQREDAPKAKARQLLNKEFRFPLKDDKEKEVSKIKYFIESAELQDEIIVKGQRAKSVKGRTFLILNLKITNEYNKNIAINSKDYIRLIIDNKKEFIAADIHNDPVQIQAISTKYTRIGFPINDTDTNLNLQIGEVNGRKETIKLNLIWTTFQKKLFLKD